MHPTSPSLLRTRHHGAAMRRRLSRGFFLRGPSNWATRRTSRQIAMAFLTREEERYPAPTQVPAAITAVAGPACRRRRLLLPLFPRRAHTMACPQRRTRTTTTSTQRCVDLRRRTRTRRTDHPWNHNNSSSTWQLRSASAGIPSPRCCTTGPPHFARRWTLPQPPPSLLTRRGVTACSYAVHTTTPTLVTAAFNTCQVCLPTRLLCRLRLRRLSNHHSCLRIAQQLRCHRLRTVPDAHVRLPMTFTAAR